MNILIAGVLLAAPPPEDFSRNKLVIERLATQMKALEADDFPTRHGASVELGQIGAPSVTPLLAALETRRHPHVWSVLASLGNVGPDAVPAVPAILVELSSSEDAEVRAVAANALEEIGADRKGVREALRKATADPDARVRIEAALAVVKLDPLDETGTAAIRAAFADVEVRDNAVRGLARLAPRVGERFVNELAITLVDTDVMIRYGSARALEGLGAAAAPATEALARRAVGAEATLDRLHAIDALAAIGSGAAKAVPALASTLQETRVPLEKMQPTGPAINLAVHSAFALLRIQPATPAAETVLLAAARNPKESINDRVKACEWLARERKDPEALQALVALNGYTNGLSRREPTRALTRLGRPEAVPALVEILSSWFQPARLEAARSLGELGPTAKPALPALHEAAQNPLDARLRREAQAAIKLIESK